MSDPAAMAVLAHDGIRRVLRQRPAHRFDRSPRELRLPVGGVRGVRPRPRPGAEDDDPRSVERRAAARPARRLRRRAATGAIRRHGHALGADDRPAAGPARRRHRRRADRRPDRLRLPDGALRRHRALGHRGRARGLAGAYGDPSLRHHRSRGDRVRRQRRGRRAHAEPVVDVRAGRCAAGGEHDLAAVRRGGRPARQQRDLRHRAGARRGPAAPGRAGRRARPRRAGLRGALRRRHRLRRHVPPGRPAVRAGPLRPDGAPGDRRAARSRATPPTCTPSVPGCCSASDATRRPTAPPGECRSHCSTSRTPRTRCGSTASRSEPPPAPRSSTTTTRSPGSPTQGLATLPIDSYVGARVAHSAVGLRVAPGSADVLGRVARLAGGTSYRSAIRRTVELGGRVYAVAANGVDAYEPATLRPLGSLAY